MATVNGALGKVTGRAAGLDLATLAPAVIAAAMISGVLVFPLFASTFEVRLGTELMFLALWAMSLNLILGNLGMISFGHAAYFGLGAYTVALIMQKTDIPFALAFIAAPVVSALGAAFVGFFCIRLRHPIYFAMLTLAFAQLAYTVAFQWYGFTGGDNGVVGFGRKVPDTLRLEPINLYYFTAAIVALCVLVMWVIARSPFGLMLKAIRENPDRAEAIGVPVQLLRWIAFVLAGFFAGIAGALFATFQRAVFPESLWWVKSGEVLIMVLLGGMGWFLGPIVGAATFFIVRHEVSSHTEYWQMVMGIILLASVLFFRQGVTGAIMSVAMFGKNQILALRGRGQGGN
jgi:branched-chain amino acid transport system permease protein